MGTVRVVIAEDHQLVRAGLQALLRQVEEVEVVGAAGDGLAAIRAVETYEPDLVLMDVAMPGLNGLEAAGRITKQWPRTKVVMLSMHANEEYLRQALKMGAIGYLLKGADLPELELAIRTVCKGQPYLTPSVSRYVLDAYKLQGERSIGPLDRLSSRQREILQLIAEGVSTKEMADRLHLSVKTVETHRAQLMERLDIHDVPGLVRLAIRVGLVQPDH